MKPLQLSVFLILYLTNGIAWGQQHSLKSNNKNYNLIISRNGDTLITGVAKKITGIIINSDSVIQPKKVKIGQPKIIPTNTNVHIISNPKITTVNKKKTSISHLSNNSSVSLRIKKGFFILNSKGEVIPTGIPIPSKGIITAILSPEITVVKEPYIAVQNPSSFSIFGKRQGLKHEKILSMLEDKKGNIWYGTAGGATKYDGKTFTNYTDKEGLNNNFVKAIIQDSKGNIWFGTDGGVTKYNGKTFTNFNEKTGLSNNNIQTVLEDSKGNLWFGTYAGAIKFDGKNLTHYTTKEGLSSNFIKSILEDSKGNLWFGTYGSGVCKFDGKNFINYTSSDGLNNNRVWAIIEDSKNNLWFATDGGICKYDSKTFTSYTVKEGLINNRVLAIMEDEKGDIWMGTNGGLVKFNNKTFTNYTVKEGLSNNQIFSIIEDENKNLWIGTNAGVSKYGGKLFSHFTKEEGLVGDKVLSITEDKNKNLWIGTNTGISKYNGKNFTNYTVKEGLTNSRVLAIIEDSKKNLWFGTSRGGVNKFEGSIITQFTRKNGLINNRVWSILEDSKGNIWFGTDGGLSKYDGNNFTNFRIQEGLGNNRILSVIKDKKGNIWLGSDGGGISKLSFNSNESSNTATLTIYSEKEGLASNRVLGVTEDSDGNIWVSTYGGGISKYIPPKNSSQQVGGFTNFTEKEGLTSNYVFSMLQDKYGNMWAGTRFGLNILEKKGDFSHFKTFSYQDGFYGIGVNGGKTIFQDSKNDVWVGANDRLTRVNTTEVFKKQLPPKIELTAIKLFDESIAWLKLENKKDSTVILKNDVKLAHYKFDSTTKWYNLPINLQLAYNNNFLTFNYIGITHFQSKKVKYQYMLEGLNSNWSGMSYKTEAHYGNLSYGSYIFKVKAINANGNTSKIYDYPFIIHPPWWLTWWAYFSYVVVAIFSVWGLIKLQTKRLKQRQKELENEVEIATTEIRKKKDEIEKQKEEVEEINREVLEKNELIEEINKEITDSINYAKGIQEAFLPQNKKIQEYLSNSFILFKPKDIVSGDFYWMDTIDDKIFFSAADCTGHGVPGAFVSLIGVNGLNRTVNGFGIIEPAKILDKLSSLVEETFKQRKDGMDISLCAINKNKNEVEYAGANNPFWLVRKNEAKLVVDNELINPNISIDNKHLFEIKADKQPVGSFEHRKPFTNHIIKTKKGDIIYLFSDGYPDQFGGPKGKKFMSKNMKKLFLGIFDQPMAEQKTKMDATLEHWMEVADTEQVDDICIFGVRI